MFETSGRMEQTILVELKRHLLPPKRRTFLMDMPRFAAAHRPFAAFHALLWRNGLFPLRHPFFDHPL